MIYGGLLHAMLEGASAGLCFLRKNNPHTVMDDPLPYETYNIPIWIMCCFMKYFRFCRGCKLECNGDLFSFGTAFIAVDWEPTALHLRYQTSQERVSSKQDVLQIFI